nr:hypothetical protein [uncultured Cellulosilyticum sp.]
MNLFERIKDMLSQKKKVTDEEMSFLKALPEFKVEPETVDNNLSILATGGPICNAADWKTITRDVVVSVEIPIGFKRDETEAFELSVSVDKSFLYTRNEKEMKTADIYINEVDGTMSTMRCRAEVIKKLLEGEVRLNVIAKGFKASDFLDATVLSSDLKLEEKTAFSHMQGVLFDETIGYMCKECNQEEQEVVVTLNIGNPFIMLADGTKIEETKLSRSAVPNMTIKQEGLVPTFDQVLNGMETIIISVPCQVTVQIEVEFIS